MCTKFFKNITKGEAGFDERIETARGYSADLQRELIREQLAQATWKLLLDVENNRRSACAGEKGHERTLILLDNREEENAENAGRVNKRHEKGSRRNNPPGGCVVRLIYREIFARGCSGACRRINLSGRFSLIC